MSLDVDGECAVLEGEITSNEDPGSAQSTVSPSEKRAGGPTLGWTLFAALGSAVIGGVSCGLAEWLAASVLLPLPAASGDWPWSLRGAALGRIIVTHLALGMPLLVVMGVLYWAVHRRRAHAAPGPFFLTTYVFLVLLTVVPAGLELAVRRTLHYAIPLYVVGAVALVGIYWGGRRLRSGLGTRRFRRVFTAGTLIALGGAMYFGGLFWRSPLRSPAGYRIPYGETSSRRFDRRHVLWIVLDTVRADLMSVYGYGQDTTPFLAEWAGQSLVFDRAIANGMWTLPSHASMFTGLPMRSHGAGDQIFWLEDQFETAAEAFRDQGYATGLFTNNSLVAPITNLNQGFDSICAVREFQKHTRFALGYLFEKRGITPPVSWLDYDSGAALTGQAVGRWLDAHAAQSVFVFVNYMEAHLPYRVPRRWREMFMTPEQVRRSYELRRRVHGDLESYLNVEVLVEGDEDLTASDREVIRLQYLATLRYLDDRVRELIEDFRRRGMLDDTLVVITADHGEYLDTHGMWSHHCLTYQDLIHVPLIIHEPRATTGRRIAEVVQLSDLYPTVLRAALGPDAARTTPYARDLLDETTARMERVAISECAGMEPKMIERMDVKNDVLARHRAAGQTAAVGSRYKLMLSMDGRRELFDLQEDPGELRDMIKDRAAMAGELDRLVGRWRLMTPRFVPTPRAEDSQGLLSDSLRLLGYVEAD